MAPGGEPCSRPGVPHYRDSPQEAELKFTLLAALLGALTLSAAASADDNAGLWMSAGSTHGSAKFVTFTVKLTADTNQSGPGASVVFTDCKAGLGLPLPQEPSAYSYTKGTYLEANQLGEIQWSVVSVPPRGAAPLMLKLTYALPRHGRPYSVCLRATAQQDVSGIRLSSNMRYFLHAAK